MPPPINDASPINGPVGPLPVNGSEPVFVLLLVIGVEVSPGPVVGTTGTVEPVSPSDVVV